MKTRLPVSAEYKQVGVRFADLSHYRFVNIRRLLNAKVHGDLLRYGRGHSPQAGHQVFTIRLPEHQRRNIHDREVRKHIQQGQARLVPARDGGSMIECVL